MSQLECNCKWHFAKQAENGQDIGPNNAATEHFAATPYPSLIRESIQNSLDVVDDASKPLRMKYEFGKLRASTFEGFYELRQHIQGVIDLYGTKAEDEYRPMLEQFDRFYSPGNNQVDQNLIYYIKVSDYNTKGMNYEPDNSPFHAFIRSLGLTIKENEYSGGSFGFGKSAYFLMSPIHTVLVSTMTKDGKTFFEGAANLCTHLFIDPQTGEKVKYLHYGYYDNQDGRGPASLQTDIPKKFSREEPGTDIYIMGIDGDQTKIKSAIKEMVESTLRNFWMAIMDNLLEVEIEDIKINSDNLNNLMNNYFADNKDRIKNGDNYNPRPYYEAVLNAGKSKDFIKIDKRLSLLGDVSLYIWKNKEARDGIIHLRKQRMFINRSRSYSSSYGYYAVFICTDNHGNKLLQSIEDPSHRKWETRRNSETGKKIIDEKDRFISECIQEIFKSNDGGALGITGLEDYLFLPEELIATNREGIDDNPFWGEPGTEIQEDGSSPDTDIENSEPNITDNGKESIGKVVATINSKGGERVSGGQYGGHQRGNNKKKRKGKGNSPDITGYNPRNTPGEGQLLENVPVRYRVIAEEKNGAIIHTIMIKTDFDIERGQIEIIVGGEENDEAIDIVSTSKGDAEANIVTNLKLTTGISNIIELKLADNMKHAIKLTAYEFR